MRHASFQIESVPSWLLWSGHMPSSKRETGTVSFPPLWHQKHFQEAMRCYLLTSRCHASGPDGEPATPGKMEKTQETTKQTNTLCILTNDCHLQKPPQFCRSFKKISSNEHHILSQIILWIHIPMFLLAVPLTKNPKNRLFPRVPNPCLNPSRSSQWWDLGPLEQKSRKGPKIQTMKD